MSMALLSPPMTLSEPDPRVSEPAGDRLDPPVPAAELSVMPDPDAETVTVAPRDPSPGEATTRWLTVDAEHVLDLAEYR
jgi:hypothetical protein